MNEHTPSPTPSRGVYGFILYLACICSFGLYTVWAVIPDSVLHTLGVTYYPQKYWAIALPVFVLVGTAIFAFFVYPGLNLLLTPPLHSIKTITDSYSTCKNFDFYQNIFDDKRAGDIPNVHGIPTASDIPITDACRALYLRK